ncbi:MAG TPA: hypothetical protein VGO93_27155 [Candidatus Xenobia bacterium]|jgi:Na+/phosphate symporter
MEFLYSQVALLHEKFTLQATAVANRFDKLERTAQKLERTAEEFRLNVGDLAKSQSNLADTIQMMLEHVLQSIQLIKSQSEQPKAIEDLTRRVDVIEKRLGPPLPEEPPDP